MFRQDLDVIDALRRDAVNVREPHPTGVAKLQTYAGQLVWIGGKFPIDVGLPIFQMKLWTRRLIFDRSVPSSVGILPWATAQNDPSSVTI